jgi:hypothetical protein
MFRACWQWEEIWHTSEAKTLFVIKAKNKEIKKHL